MHAQLLLYEKGANLLAAAFVLAVGDAAGVHPVFVNRFSLSPPHLDPRRRGLNRRRRRRAVEGPLCVLGGSEVLQRSAIELGRPRRWLHESRRERAAPAQAAGVHRWKPGGVAGRVSCVYVCVVCSGGVGGALSSKL